MAEVDELKRPELERPRVVDGRLAQYKWPQDTYAMVGKSLAMNRLRENLDYRASSRGPLTLVGERGSGKTLAMHYIRKKRRLAPNMMRELSCAMPPETIYGELCGYRKGAFTGALNEFNGLLGNGGMVVINEPSGAPVHIQQIFKSFYDSGEYRKMGSSLNEAIKTLIVFAENQNLKALAEAGRFMPDLLDRMKRAIIYVPH